MRTNMANWDRALRLGLGIALFGLGATRIVGGALSIVCLAAALVPIATGLTGYCPLYRVLHVQTKRT